MDALHISFQLQAILTKRKHSNSQLDTAPVKSIELSHITPVMNLTLKLKLHGEERRKSNTNWWREPHMKTIKNYLQEECPGWDYQQIQT